MPYKLNIFTGNLDLVRSDGSIAGTFLRLDTSNDPLTGELYIAPSSGTSALRVTKAVIIKDGEKLYFDGA